MLKTVFFVFILVHATETLAQLRSGFDKEEYMELLRISVQSSKDTACMNAFEPPKKHHLIYQSQNIGLDNSWDLWLNETKGAVISIRGTTKKQESWLENFYAAMVPAKGELQLDSSIPFNYQLAENPRATVHVGWLVGMAFISRELVPKIEELYQNNTKEFVIIGHSQGGGIAFLLTAYLYNLQRIHRLPMDIRFKTYCSGAPKPGNLYFAYDYETLTQFGWSHTVVNPLDWVPETPFSIQTLDDMNAMNPFSDALTEIKKQKFPKNLIFHFAFNKLVKPSKKAQRNYQLFLGDLTYKAVVKYLDKLKVPEYATNNNYVRTGTTIVLPVDSEYEKQFFSETKSVFLHHSHKSYFFLASKMTQP